MTHCMKQTQVQQHNNNMSVPFSELYNSIKDRLTFHYKMSSMQSNQTKRTEKIYNLNIEFDGRYIKIAYISPILLSNYDVLENLVIDARNSFLISNFYDFCLEFGFDDRLEKNYRFYKDFKQLYREILYLFGDALARRLIDSLNI